jgi:hypothetical protein
MAYEKKFNTFINKKYLDMSQIEIEKLKLSTDKNDISIIQKDNKIMQKLDIMFWLEKLINFERDKISDINYDNIDNINELLNKKIHELIILSDGTKSKKELKNRYKEKINNIENISDLQKFMMGCYNSFGNIMKVKYKKIRIKETNDYEYIKIYKLL